MTFLILSQVIPEETLDAIDKHIAQLTWKDGRETAGRTAKKVKRNEQADLTSASGKAISKAVTATLKAHPVFKAAARPRRFSKLLLSKTSNGGRYGAHVDNALMGKDASRMRTDLSFTLFLGNADSYQGGELTVHLPGWTQSYKGDRGDLILYGSSYIHEVAPVTSGERIACVGWVESLVTDEAQRALLFDLDNLRASLRSKIPEATGELLTLDKTVANLMRMWAQP